jgi:hypothetical protein
LYLPLAVTSGKKISLRSSGNKNRLAVSGNAVTNSRSFANAVTKAVIKIPGHSRLHSFPRAVVRPSQDVFRSMQSGLNGASTVNLPAKHFLSDFDLRSLPELIFQVLREVDNDCTLEQAPPPSTG